MAATTSWSNQLTRLFNGPLDRESVFATHDALTSYLATDEICYSGQIVAVLDDDYRGGAIIANGSSNVLRIYALQGHDASDPGVTIDGANGGHWTLSLLASADSTISNSKTADKLTTARNLKLNDSEGNIDGKTGVNFDGSADVQIPVKLVDRAAIDAFHTANGGVNNTEFVMVKVNKQGIVIDGALTIGQEKIEFGKKDSLTGNRDGKNTFDDFKIEDDLDNLANVTISGATQADKDILQYDATTDEWVNKSLADAGIAAKDHKHELNDLTDVDLTNKGASDSDAKYPQDKKILLYDKVENKWKPATLREADIYSKTEHIETSPGMYEIGEDSSDPTKPSYYAGLPIKLNQYGKIDPSLLPPMSLTSVYQCDTMAQMLSYHKDHHTTIGKGSVMIVADTIDSTVMNGKDSDGNPIHVAVPKTFMYSGEIKLSTMTDNSLLSDWIELSEAGSVISVNGKQGTIYLTALDVYAPPLIDNNKNGAVTPGEYVRVKVNKYGLTESGEDKLKQKYIVFEPDNTLSDLGIVDILDSLNDVQIGKKPVMKPDPSNPDNLIQDTNPDNGEPLFVGNEVADKDVLAYDKAQEKWVNKTLSQLDAKAVLEADITVQQGVNGTVGGVKTGDLLPKGMTLQKVLEKILIKQIAYTYTKPTLTFTISTTEAEVGTQLTGIGAKAKFNDTKGDAGDVTSLEFLFNGVQVQTATSMAKNVDVPCNEPYDVYTEGNQVMTAKVSYAAGPIKNDNLGDPSPAGQVQAGTLTQTKNLYGYRKTFVSSGATGTTPTTSGEVRAFSRSMRSDTNKSFNINVNVGDKFFCIATPHTLKSVIAVNQSNAEIMGNFIKTTVNVEGANGFTAKEYNVYTYVPNAAFGNTDILKITLQ